MKSTFMSLSKAMFLGYTRDRAAMFFTIIFPLMFLVLFGGIFKDSSSSRSEIIQIGHVPIFDSLDSGGKAALDDVIKVKKTTDRDDALEDVRKGDYDAAVEQRGDEIIVHYSATDAVKGATVRGVLHSMVQQANIDSSGQPPKYSFSTDQVEDDSLKAIQYMTPGLLGWAIATGATFGAALTLVNWRQKKILRRLRLAPVGTAPIVASRVGVSILIALAQTAIFIGVASIPYFGLQLSDNWWLSIPLVLAGTLSFMAIGLLAGAWAKTQESASAIVNLVVLPMAFLSGSFIPLDASPQWLQTIAKIFPLHYLVDGMQDVMVRGEGASAIVLPLAVLLAFAGVVTFIASRIFRWDDI